MLDQYSMDDIKSRGIFNIGEIITAAVMSVEYNKPKTTGLIGTYYIPDNQQISFIATDPSRKRGQITFSAYKIDEITCSVSRLAKHNGEYFTSILFLPVL